MAVIRCVSRNFFVTRVTASAIEFHSVVRPQLVLYVPLVTCDLARFTYPRGVSQISVETDLLQFVSP